MFPFWFRNLEVAKMKMKQCTKCKKQKPFSEFSKKLSTKDGLRCWCKECDYKSHKKYRQTHKIEIAEYRKKYCRTIVGSLRERFYQMEQRCNNSKATGYKNWGGRGIKCLFKSSNEFVDYVLNELQVDPRGLAVDRINNDGHYEKGNIRLVTQAENNKNNRRKRK